MDGNETVDRLCDMWLDALTKVGSPEAATDLLDALGPHHLVLEEMADYAAVQSDLCKGGPLERGYRELSDHVGLLSSRRAALVGADQLQQVGEGLRLALDYFRKRDEANAVVHVADMRYSPITVKMEQALAALDGLHQVARA
jgi:hypothetical protein